MLAQLVEDLVHLERGEDRLDQHGGADRARAGCRARPARGRTRRSRAAPRGGSRASAGRSTGPCRARAARARCGRRRARSRRGSPRRARRRRAGASRAGASRAGGRRASRSPRSAGRSSRPVSSSIVPRTASARFSWPSTTLSQVGESASSKSAMKTRAPELSALIIILRSTGPVISTRRSSRSAGGGATCQSPSRTPRVSGRKSGSAPRVELGLALAPALEQLERGRVQLACSCATKSSASGVRISVVAPARGARRRSARHSVAP